jgi:hypothetical protein
MLGCEAEVFTGPGKFQNFVLSPGDVGYAPSSSAHYLRALGNEPVYAILMFNRGHFTNIDMPVFLSQVPNQVRRGLHFPLYQPSSCCQETSLRTSERIHTERMHGQLRCPLQACGSFMQRSMIHAQQLWMSTEEFLLRPALSCPVMS